MKNGLFVRGVSPRTSNNGCYCLHKDVMIRKYLLQKINMIEPINFSVQGFNIGYLDLVGRWILKVSFFSFSRVMLPSNTNRKRDCHIIFFSRVFSFIYQEVFLGIPMSTENFFWFTSRYHRKPINLFRATILISLQYIGLVDKYSLRNQR